MARWLGGAIINTATLTGNVVMRAPLKYLSRYGLLLYLWLAALPARSAPSFVQNGNILTMSNLNVTVQYNLSTGNAAFYWQNLQIISAFYSGIGFSSGYVMGIHYASWSYSVISSNQVMVTAVGNGHPTMKQIFTFDATNSFLVQVQATGANVSANWMGPVVVNAAGGVDIHSYGDDRALFVPFDNDKNVTYNAMSINSSSTGYEVGAFYDNVSRNGLVVGSVTHDTWKSGVYWQGSGNTLTQMNVFGGANSSTTHDTQPHGFVTGSTISSPTMFVGYGLDWRKTMNDFADENLKFAPKLTWTNGVPFGWNSWGVIQESINYTDATNASGFIFGNLQGTNFNDNGVVYINLDSYWDNLNGPPSQVPSFVNYCHANGQKVGLYLAPYAWFGAASNAPTTTVVQGYSYTYDQIILKTTNGTYETDGSGIALDPTHPGTQLRVSYYINEFTNWGIDYLKIDFLTHAALEGVHYNTNIVTGIQAYNVGLQYIYNLIGGKVFISESIAPLFPYQYGHSRRIACDAEASKIANTAYTLNSVTYGWWLDRLYCFNDPDIMVFDGPTTNENQSRLISGAITGLFLNGDSFLDPTSDADAINCLTNAAINAVARYGQTFLATEQNTGTSAANVFTQQYGTTPYVAVFNYGSSSLSTNVNLARAGISNVFSAVDLWSGSSNAVTGTNLAVTLNAGQGKLFKLLNMPYLQTAQMGTNGSFSFSLFGNDGSVYAIDATTNFTSWNTVATVTNISGNMLVSLPAPSGPANYYRARFLQ